MPVVIPQLHCVALETNPILVQDLLRRGVDPNVSETLWGDEPAPHSAVGCRHPNASAVHRALLAGGANPEAADGHGETALLEWTKGLRRSV